MRSTLAGITEKRKLPWSDVIIDCQGPFTTSERGMKYTVSYHCAVVGVCKIEPIKSLQKSDFLHGLVPCIMRARRIPDVVRTDRGPEMTSAVMEEFSSLCNTRHVLGAAFTPRHQGPGERKHVEVMQHWLLFMHRMTQALSTEWCTLAPVVEYLIDTEINETDILRL